MINDPVADILTRMRNAMRVGKATCRAPASRFAEKILDVLVREGYLLGYARQNVRQGIDELVVDLKYDKGRPVIEEISRVSRLGRRSYSQIRRLPRVNNGLGIFVLSTSKGVLSDREALAHHVGGEIVCRVY
ncbi:30S ribosomal protein S8 [Candidatus Hepatobacter penaei]|jgi:small subunit ribosomal protein S8|uniref:30S ribosomal protein S8 n=1 Tax=Candidatus Hepatobacter penaei TaxID=1274402 RepID=UPI0004F3D326|nr:30S ribosomal protein S8 [Candidatus Hepatobacter penaei]TGW15902.1 30S ribosomal protein S8 [bacterium NHP-B]